MKIITAVLASILCVASVTAQDLELGRSKPKQKPAPVAAPPAEVKPAELIAAPEQTPAATPMPSVKGHTLGEALNCSTMTPQKEVKQWKGILRGGSKVVKSAVVCDPTGNWEENRLGDQLTDGLTYGLMYKAGKLVKMNLMFIRNLAGYRNEINGELMFIELTQKFGKPTSSIDIENMNGFGAKWQDQVFYWELPGIYASLILNNNPADQSANFEMMTPKEHNTTPAPKKLLD